jgi:NAD(P)-dependent dehydrogenase (short-subunit alcohol dehydrogenase family)
MARGLKSRAELIYKKLHAIIMKSDNSINKIVLITGSTDGIGKLAALQLAENGLQVIIHGRNKEKVKRVVDEIIIKSGNEKIKGVTADFSSLDEVHELTKELKEEYSAINILINNAGVGFADERYSKDKYELRFAVNYLAPFLLTKLLLPELKQGAPSRIVNVSSIGQVPINFDDIMFEKKFDAVDTYRQSKLALIMFTFDLAEKLKNENITINTLHPGTFLNTNMVRNSNITPLGKAESGADAIVYLATSSELDKVTGKYFNVKSEARADSQAYDEKVRKHLWELSLQLTGLKEV